VKAKLVWLEDLRLRLEGIVNIPSPWPIIRATTPSRERRIWNVASSSYRFAASWFPVIRREM